MLLIKWNLDESLFHHRRRMVGEFALTQVFVARVILTVKEADIGEFFAYASRHKRRYGLINSAVIGITLFDMHKECVARFFAVRETYYVPFISKGDS